MFRDCTKPVISYGVICQRRDGRFLVVQRKDSFAFVEFMRGKYSLTNRRYLLQLFDGMSTVERGAIATLDFDSLWRMMWSGFAKSKSRPEYGDSSSKFARLREGVRINGDAHDTDIAWLIASTAGRGEPEWGFPKGRRSASNEPDMACALREMYEETGIACDQVEIVDMTRYEESFQGNNGVRYMHVYFLARLLDDHARVRICDREIKSARWATYRQVRDLMWDAPSRLDMLRCIRCPVAVANQ